MEPKAEVNFTTSSGDKFSPGFPPIVPLIPDIDFIKDTSGVGYVRSFKKLQRYKFWKEGNIQIAFGKE